jgi:hypothetical protein
MQNLDMPKQKIKDAKESTEMWYPDQTDPLLISKKKKDELSLRFTISKTETLLNSLREGIIIDRLALKQAIIASTLSAISGMIATYALYILYPLNKWMIGQYTWQIGLVVALIATFYVWKTVGYNSLLTQVIIAVILTPFLL